MLSQKRSRAAFEADLQAHQSPYVFYGSALPPSNPEVRDDGSYVPIWKQEVFDEHGRKRLHGAFTGGFSAGYFNTVGSKEGWTPSNYVSSRVNRHASMSKLQRPEEYMDEEDIADAADSERILTSRNFRQLGADTNEEPSNEVFGLLRPLIDSIGSRLLQRMGWRSGQGIGPRVRRRARLGTEDEMKPDDSSISHLFAPEDSAMICLMKKTNERGLGQSGDSPLEKTGQGGRQSQSTLRLNAVSMGSGKKFLVPHVKKTGSSIEFLGGSDSDEDPYSMGPRLSYNRSLPQQKEPKKTSGRKQHMAINPLLKKRTVLSKVLSERRLENDGLKRCQDGRLPLEGFVLTTQQSQLNESNFLLPDIPTGWKSRRESDSQGPHDKLRTTTTIEQSSHLNPSSRASILGEGQLPGKSVFDYLTNEARNHIASVSGKLNIPPGRGEGPPPGYLRSSEQTSLQLRALVPYVAQDVAAQALSRGWMPYSEDEAKRARYRTFLEFHARMQKALPTRESGVGIQAWVKEMEEFSRAANVFGPIKGLMASRFTSASSPDIGSQVEGVGENGAKSSSRPFVAESFASLPGSDEEAARLGMYGHLTRCKIGFIPTQLLCKRFGVVAPNNAPDKHMQLNTSVITQPMGDTEALRSQSSSHLVDLQGQLTNSLDASKHLRSDDHNLNMLHAEAIVNSEFNEALESARLGQQTFKAIFGGDESE